jgi:hypothetical protein
MKQRGLWPTRWDDRVHMVIVGALPIAVVVAYAAVRIADEGKLKLAPGTVSHEVRDLLWFSLVAGIASYATIEIANRVARTRGHFQRWQTRRWFEERTRNSTRGWKAFDQLLSAWRIGYRQSLQLFDLHTEQLAAQISSAVDVAVSRPKEYSDLLACFSGSKDDTPTDPDAPPPGEDQREFRLAQRVRLGVDQLQIVLADRWRRTVQGAAIWVAGLFGIGLAHAIDQPVSTEPSYVLAALLIGGPLAWLVHDLAALVEHARG